MTSSPLISSTLPRPSFLLRTSCPTLYFTGIPLSSLADERHEKPLRKYSRLGENVGKRIGIKFTRTFAGRNPEVITLFPLNRCRRLRRDVVDDAVYAAHLVDDAVAHFGQHVEGDSRPVGGHEILAFDGADGDDAVVAAAVAHDADRADRQEDGEDLRGFAIEVVRDEFL